LIGNPDFERDFLRTPQPSYLAVGTADPFYSAEALVALKNRRDFQLTVIEGADHGMNVPGDPQASAAAVSRVTAEVTAFVTA
jgi:dienelactone hydrolase